MTNNNSSNTPKWVEALHTAEDLLRKAADAGLDEQHSLNRLAQTWISISWAYRDELLPTSEDEG